MLRIGMKLVLCSLLMSIVWADDPRVETSLGSIVGTTRVTEKGTTFHAFRMVPYAKPPINELRFKPPQPIESWEGDYKAYKREIYCIQMSKGSILGTEDCLYLNVFTPQLPDEKKKLLSVIFYIHGGGFTIGSSSPSFAGFPDYLMDKDVVLVTVNYRLGPFGFLSTEDSEAPGNYGMLDMVEALRWVKKNIRYFGGNPGEVTIAGESTGGASVNSLRFSRLTKGLFHKAIQSGNIISPFTFMNSAEKLTESLAQQLDCPLQPSSKFLKCLRKVSAGDILKTSLGSKGNFMKWLPRIDKESDKPLFPMHPKYLLQSGNFSNAPCIIGYVRDEMELLGGKRVKRRMESRMQEDFSEECFKIVDLNKYKAEEYDKERCEKIWRDHVNNNEQLKEEYIKKHIDVFFGSESEKSKALMAKYHPIYYFRFDFESDKSLQSILYPHIKKRKGVVYHADDLLYLFKYKKTGWTVKSPEYKMVEVMTSLWASFAKTGKPVYPNNEIIWPGSYKPNFKQLIINTKPSIIEKEINCKGKQKFWNNLIKKALEETEPKKEEL